MEIRDIALVIIVSSLQKVYTQNKMFTCGETWSERLGIKLFFFLDSLYYLETTLKNKTGQMHYLLNTYVIQVILTLSFAGVISSGSLNFNALEMVINNASTTNNFSIFLKTFNLSETIDLFSQGKAWV